MGKRVVDVEERLPWYQALPLGLQHFLSMFGATVLVPMLMGFSPSVSVMCSGIGTALYLVATKGKIPSYLGPSFSFVGPVVIASATAWEWPGSARPLWGPAWCSSCALWWCARRERAGSIDSFPRWSWPRSSSLLAAAWLLRRFRRRSPCPRARRCGRRSLWRGWPSSWSCCARASGSEC